MIYVRIPDQHIRRLPFYLATEEFLAQKSAQFDDDVFFMWQVPPTVIFGRNQIIDNEVDLAYCSRNDIQVYRRRSGGGCVFANRDNIMMSYITASASPVAITFARYTSMVAEMLRSLGLNVEVSSRNDILIEGRKVSGNAFYHLSRGAIVHGTMLFDTDRTQMSRAITPSKQKIDAKGVESVRSHITTLREHIDMDIEHFKNYVRDYLCQSEMMLTADDLAEIEKIERAYYDPSWIFGRRSRDSRRSIRRIEGVGEFCVELSQTPDGRIADLNLSGDFFLVGDIDKQIIGRLRDVPYCRADVESALSSINVSEIIYGLENEQLINLLF